MYAPRASALEAARDVLGLSTTELWLDYFGLGGNLPPATIDAVLAGRADLDDHTHDLLVQALNERFIERGQNHPLLYAEELPPLA